MAQNGDIDSEIKEIVSRVTKLPADSINPAADLFKDLGVDSLLGVEIFAALDKKFNIDIPENKLDKIRTLNDIIALAREKLKDREGAGR